jgi:hypothetical protein
MSIEEIRHEKSGYDDLRDPMLFSNVAQFGDPIFTLFT